MYVHNINLEFTDAVRRFFVTKVEENSLKQKGKYEEKLVVQRRRNRIKRVCQLCDMTIIIIVHLRGDPATVSRILPT